jgi:hypothetical protein
MISEKQLEANHQNALRSTGPNTADGVEAIKLNALRHGLRSVQNQPMRPPGRLGSGPVQNQPMRPPGRTRLRTRKHEPG